MSVAGGELSRQTGKQQMIPRRRETTISSRRPQEESGKSENTILKGQEHLIPKWPKERSDRKVDAESVYALEWWIAVVETA